MHLLATEEGRGEHKTQIRDPFRVKEVFQVLRCNFSLYMASYGVQHKNGNDYRRDLLLFSARVSIPIAYERIQYSHSFLKLMQL